MVGDTGPDIAWAQGKLGIAPADGCFDESTAARVRGIQVANRLPVTGELDEETVACLIRLR